MKKKTFLLLLIICITLFGACNADESADSMTDGTNSADNSIASAEVKEFINFIDTGEYLKAAEYYNEKLYGNYAFEAEATNEIVKLLNSLNGDILGGQKTEEDSKKAIVVIDNVLSKTNLYIDDYDEMKESIEASVASKASFSAGKELETLKNYIDAIAEYKNVIEADSNFSEAQTSIERCTTTLKQNVFDKAASLVGNNDYIEAIAQLKELSDKLPEDDEVIAKITVYEKTYISNAIDNAAEVFVTPQTDYSKALEVINGALQHYANNEELNAKKEYYQSFAPVYLYDMEKLKGSADTLETDKDIFGNEYTKNFWAGYGDWMLSYGTDISFNLNKTYNTFTATVFSRSKKNDVQYMKVEIYADGEVIYQNLNIPDNSTQPFDIELDVTGVSELRIVLGKGSGTIGAGIGMTDMIVQKTVK